MFKKILLVVITAIVGLIAYAVLIVGVDVPLSALLPDEYRPKSEPSELTVADGYGISVFADVPGARMLEVTPLGNLIVSSSAADKVFLVQADRDGDGRSDGRSVMLDMENPNGIDLANGYLYVAQDHQVARVPFDTTRDVITGAVEPLITGLPTGGNHWRKTVRIGPDGVLYLTIGSTCNVCEEADDRRAAMLVFTAEGEPLGHFATGLRNTTDFDWSPADGALYGVDMGRDLLGDDYPPCELNRIVEGGFYGWPFANADRIPDPDYGEGRASLIASSRPPVHGFKAHNSPLGIRFLRADAHPSDYRHAAIVPLHGSWNRTDKDGYKVVSLHWTDDGIEERDFVTGFLQDNTVGGRPAGVTEDAEGHVYVSDDFANRIYRITPGSTATARVDAPAMPSSAAEPVVLSAAQQAAGAELYAASGCDTCHGAGAGMVPLDDLQARYDVDALARYLAEPPQPMPPVASSDDRRRLARYLLHEG